MKKRTLTAVFLCLLIGCKERTASEVPTSEPDSQQAPSPDLSVSPTPVPTPTPVATPTPTPIATSSVWVGGYSISPRKKHFIEFRVTGNSSTGYTVSEEAAQSFDGYTLSKMSFHPNGRVLYAHQGSLQAYEVGMNNQLSLQTTPLDLPSDSFFLKPQIDPSGNFLFTSSQNHDYVIRLSPNRLEATEYTAFGDDAAPAAMNPVSFWPGTPFLFVRNSNYFRTWSFASSTLSFTKTSGGDDGFGGHNSYNDAMAVHPNGNVVYVSERDIPANNPPISYYSVNKQTGSLTKTSTVLRLERPVSLNLLQFVHDGRFLVGVDRFNFNLYVFSVNATDGHLEHLSKTTMGMSGNILVQDAELSQSGLVAAVGGLENKLSLFQIHSETGAVTPLTVDSISFSGKTLMTVAIQGR